MLGDDVCTAADTHSRPTDEPQPLTGGAHADASQPSKRRRQAEASTTRQKRRSKKPRKLGRLRQVMDLPVDLLYEIFQYVWPPSLLNLSRATKAFRNLLMSRSARHIWQSSLARVDGLPPVPTDMTEPEECARKHFAPYCDVRDRFGLLASVAPDDTSLAKMLPYVRLDVRFDMVQRSDEELHLLAAIAEDPQAVQKWFAAKETDFERWKKHVRLCEDWYYDEADAADEDRDLRRDRRQKAIEQRLTDLGWGDELAKLPEGALGEQKSVRIVTPLSARGWLSMKDRLVSFLTHARDERLAKEKAVITNARRKLLKTVYPDFCRSKPFRAILPGVGDLVTAPAIVQVFDEAPCGTEPSAASLLNALATIPQSFFDAWRARCEQELVALAQECLQNNPALKQILEIDSVTANDLRLATLVFCPRNMLSCTPYPDILNMSYFHEDDREQPWSAKNIDLNDSAPHPRSALPD
ncbi:hypothetical protein BD626DRAFT_599428 [Schizophyllum amplum]|uniref:F-box domain-containing protein n=1 Tax=Schizophyllum amplum TaxID=97359 RepID=A0A550C9A2_9AGAR|nr:hypothetical protein BD626DRAFT_599428 [Auriculariopsis ampla]